MLQISAQQLAELLAGIARAQAAVINGLENELAGVRSGRVVPALQNVAHMRDHPDPTLVDLPVRVLLASLGRGVGPDIANVARDLERLFGGAASPAAAPAAAASAPAPMTTKSDAGGGDALDFSAPKAGG